MHLLTGINYIDVDYVVLIGFRKDDHDIEVIDERLESYPTK